MGTFIVWYLIMLICGALIGLIPYGVGIFLNKPRFGQLGLILCSVSALIHPSIPLVLAVGLVIAQMLARNDIYFPGQSSRISWSQPSRVVSAPAYGIRLICVAGPLKGQAYSIGTAGLTIGRDNSCVVRLPDSTPGISRNHCRIQFQQGCLMLVDMNSAYGTYLANGTRLPQHYPTQLVSGSRFYLGSPNVMFEIRYQ